MNHRRSISLCLLGLLALTLLARPARADVVHLNDGRSFTGIILSETDKQLVIDTMVAGIRAKLPLKVSDVQSIDRGPVPDDFFGGKKKGKDEGKDEGKAKDSDKAKDEGKPAASAKAAPTAPAPAEPTDIGKTPYLLIPLSGAFGKEIVSDGVKETLDYAQKHKVKHIVFVLDSPGGRVDVAEEMLKMMKDYSGKITFHTIIKDAISASIWVVFASDTIHIVAGGTVGGAVAFSQNMTTGSAEVDAKMNSILCANIRAMADMKAHPSVLVEAMMVQDATAAAWKDKWAQVHIEKSLPRDVPTEQVIFNDTSKTILTLTSGDAIKIKLALPIDRADPALLGELLGLEDWRLFNDYGKWAMTEKSKLFVTHEETIGKNHRRIDELVGVINNNIEEASRDDPEKQGGYMYFSNSGRFTTDSKRLWIQRTNACIASWDRVKAAITELETLEKQNVEEFKQERHIDELQIKDWKERTDREMKRLKINRNRDGV
ncbi:MAG: hypothetical protein WD042_07910 [Phycisphaeraceae bacterium]